MNKEHWTSVGILLGVSILLPMALIVMTTSLQKEPASTFTDRVIFHDGPCSTQTEIVSDNDTGRVIRASRIHVCESEPEPEEDIMGCVLIIPHKEVDDAYYDPIEDLPAHGLDF